MSAPPVAPRRLAPLAFVATVVSLAIVSYFLWQAEHKQAAVRQAQAEALRQSSYAKGRQDENKALIATVAPSTRPNPPGDSNAPTTAPKGAVDASAPPTAAPVATGPSDHNLYLAVAGLLSVIFTVFGFVILLGTYPDDTKKWAMGILGTILGFWLGVPKS